MNERNHYYPDWDDSEYGTGPTKPPKNRGAMVALMLILIIFLCGIITVLGVMNIRLFQKLQLREQKESAMSFTVCETQSATVPPTVSQQPVEQAVASINLETSPQSKSNLPDPEGLSLQDIYLQNIDSVVSITSILAGGSSTGTGVVLTPDGYLVTNAHVVEGAGTIQVTLTGGAVYPALLVGKDEVTDLAVLHIDVDDLKPAQFGDSSSLRIGDTVVAIGDPLGVKFRGTYTDGIVSGIDRDVNLNGRTMTLIQTNAALNSGNSGGPLINCFGQVVGINTMKISAFTDKAGVEGLGFAIPSTTVKEVVEQLMSQGYVSGRPTLGIDGDGLSAFYQHYYHIPAGVYITHVSRTSDAYQKGVEEGDLILSINETRITTQEELRSAVANLNVGDSVEVVIFRNGTEYQVTLKLSEDKGGRS